MIPLSVPNLCGNEIRYVTQAITDGWVSTGGPSINKFEDEFACYSGAEFTVACQSGTAALHLALADAGLGAGDLVVAPTLTFIASINPIRFVGAEPVFMDCDDGLCLDPAKLEQYLREECELREGCGAREGCETRDGYGARGGCETRGGGVSGGNGNRSGNGGGVSGGNGSGTALYDKTLGKPVRAVIAVHIFGNTADLARIAAICKQYGIILIEDATEAVGTFFTTGALEGKMAGAVGEYGAYSFNGNKIITTGGGGMVTSPSSESVRRMRHLSTQAKTDDIYYTHDEVGFNYRMTNVQAAIGMAQIEQLETFIEIKRANYLLYREYGLDLLPFRDGCRPNYWFYSYLCPMGGDVASFRDGLIRHLYGKGIQTRPVWSLCHEQPMYRQNRAYKIERAPYYRARIVNLPCSTNLTSKDVRRVAETIEAYKATV